MTRMSMVLLMGMSLALGCTSDQLGFRSTYRDRNVPAMAQPFNNSPVAGPPGGQLGAPMSVGQSVIMPQASVSNLARSQQRSGNGWNSPYPMLASNGGQIDGRPYPYLKKEALLPPAGGSKSRKSAVHNTVQNTALAGGVSSSPQEDLKYRGGHIIQNLKFVNIFVGGPDSWVASDYKSIDAALKAAMSDEKLNNVVMQYFNNQPVTSEFLGSFYYPWKPKLVQKNDISNQVRSLDGQRVFDKYDLPNTVFNFMLPRGTILGDPSGGRQQTASNKAIPLADAEDSTGGLGGYHGSVHLGGKTVYYAVGVFSERLPDGKANGIPVFNQNWKNVVATFYHELNEARTDADVDDAATSPQGMAVLGWTSDTGNEIGDYPIAEATQLLQVFQEVPLADGSGTVPIQFNYSNAVHGPEGPIDYPHGMEPGPGSVPPRNQPSNNPPPNNPPPNNSPPKNQPFAGLPPELTDLIQNWGQLEDYVKKAILKLAS